MNDNLGRVEYSEKLTQLSEYSVAIPFLLIPSDFKIVVIATAR